MSTIYDLFLMDSALETDGVCVCYGESKLWIARAGGSNHRYRDACVKILGPHRNRIDSGLVSEDEDRRLMAKVYSSSIVRNWENVFDLNGTPIPFTEGNVEKVLVELPDLLNDIRQIAVALSNYRKGAIDTIVKNS